MRSALGIGFAALACLTTSPLAAQTYYLSGKIGKAPVFAAVTRDGGNLSGWYLYTRHEKKVELLGTIDASGKFHLDESSFDSAKKTGIFSGSAQHTIWSGTWQGANGGAQTAFTLTEDHDTLAKLDGDFHCTKKYRDRKYGYDYSRSAHVTLVKGAVTRLDLAQTSQSKDGDSQGCYISLDDFKRVPSDAGALFRAKADKSGGDGQHCTVHVVADGNRIFVFPGDLSEKGNDCKGADDEVMFCSPRADWGDFLIDSSGVCKPND